MERALMQYFEECRNTQIVIVINRSSQRLRDSDRVLMRADQAPRTQLSDGRAFSDFECLGRLRRLLEETEASIAQSRAAIEWSRAAIELLVRLESQNSIVS
jgi:hypothetical protein